MKNSRICVTSSLLLLLSLFSVVNVWAADYENNSQVTEFINEMVSEHKFDRQELISLFAQVEKKQAIIDAISRPAEKTKTWAEYGDIFIQQSRIDKGVEFWKNNADTLNRAEKEYGVPPSIIVAIIGVETRYGSNTGSYRVMDALSTLGFDYPPRATFFRKELVNFLLLSREQKQNPLDLTGSYAGAMGYGQFMPSSYRAYAVDFDGDGFTDIWHNADDAIGSVANYFARHGWQGGESIASRARVTKSYDESFLTTQLALKHSVADLKKAGIEPIDTVDPAQKAMAFKLDGKMGAEFWIGYTDFYVITRYNHSHLYAMAVYQLGEAIRQQYNAQG